MDEALRAQLVAAARARISNDDPSHDWNHISRVSRLAEYLAKREGADLDVVIPGALFHDVVNYPKNDPRAEQACDESAALARSILAELPGYPKEKISLVEEAITHHSFSKGLVPPSLEGKIVQDADRLEATGAISIMRTFSSTGQMRRPFYEPSDPFCERREPDPKQFAVDLFYKRLLVVEEKMNTRTAKKLARSRTRFLRAFLKQLKTELALVRDE